MKFIFSKRVQAAALVAVLGLCILAVIQVLQETAVVFAISGPTGVAVTAPIACAAGLFAWVAKCLLAAEDEKTAQK